MGQATHNKSVYLVRQQITKKMLSTTSSCKETTLMAGTHEIKLASNRQNIQMEKWLHVSWLIMILDNYYYVNRWYFSLTW